MAKFDGNVEPAQSAVSAQKVDVDEIRLDLARASGVAWMLVRCYGGEIAEGEGPADEDIVCCIQFINRVLHRVSVASNESLSGDFHTALCDGRGIASALDAMTWADGMRIYGSREVMCQLFDALDKCIEDALRFLHSESDADAVAPALQPRSRRAPPQAERAKAQILETI